jgi:hypothetical protein
MSTVTSKLLALPAELRLMITKQVLLDGQVHIDDPITLGLDGICHRNHLQETDWNNKWQASWLDASYGDDRPSDPRRYSYPITKEVHPYLLVNHQLYTEGGDVIRKTPYLRTATIDVIVKDEERLIPIWRSYPPYRCRNFSEIVVRMRPVTTTPAYPPTIANEVRIDFWKLWSTEGWNYTYPFIWNLPAISSDADDDNGLPLNAEALLAVLHGILNMRMNAHEPFTKESLRRHVFTVDQLTVVVETREPFPNERPGPPLWLESGYISLPQKAYMAGHTLEPAWLFHWIEKHIEKLLSTSFIVQSVPGFMTRAQYQTLDLVVNSHPIYRQVGRMQIKLGSTTTKEIDLSQIARACIFETLNSTMGQRDVRAMEQWHRDALNYFETLVGERRNNKLPVPDWMDGALNAVWARFDNCYVPNAYAEDGPGYADRVWTL